VLGEARDARDAAEVEELLDEARLLSVEVRLPVAHVAQRGGRARAPHDRGPLEGDAAEDVVGVGVGEEEPAHRPPPARRSASARTGAVCSGVIIPSTTAVARSPTTIVAFACQRSPVTGP
jgi:hypothetical protein